jgi:hypothetical protein
VAVIECRRCGLRWEANSARKNVLLCSSCRARKAKTVPFAVDRCVPWHGLFAEDELTPIDEYGVPVLPGLRFCGKKDCVNEDHIERGF